MKEVLEGHYTVKKVNKLPKKGNANWLYSIFEDEIREFHIWTGVDEGYKTITIGGSQNITNIIEGENVTITGTGTQDDPLIINSPDTFTPSDLLTDYNITLAPVAITNNYGDLNNTPIFEVVENEYSTMSEMYLDQVSQNETFIQFVADASSHPDIETGDTYFEYLGTNNVDETDYRILTDTEVSGIGLTISKTSDIPLNDGSDGTSVYVELDELSTVATTNNYDDLDNLPATIPQVTRTSDILNDGVNNTSTYVEVDDLSQVAFSNDYEDLDNKPENLSQFNNDPGYLTSPSNPNAFYVREGGILADARPFEVDFPYPTLVDAIAAYKVYDYEFAITNNPRVDFIVLDRSEQIIENIGILRSTGINDIINIISNGNIIIRNTDTTTPYCPFSRLGMYNDVPTRNWTVHGTIKTTGNVTFEGSGEILLGEFRNLNQIICNTLTMSTGHQINGITADNTDFTNIKKYIKANTTILNTVNNAIAGSLKNLEVDLGSIIINGNGTSLVDLRGASNKFSFNEIITDSEFNFGRFDSIETEINHGNIKGTYTGNAFSLYNRNILNIKFKDNVVIDLPVYFSPVFNAPVKYVLNGSIVTYINSPYLLGASAFNFNGNTTSSEISHTINIKELNIPNGDLISSWAGNGSTANFRSGAGIHLINSTLNIGGIITSGFGISIDSDFYDTIPPVLLKITGKCYINSNSPNNTTVISSQVTTPSGNPIVQIDGELTISNGVIDSTNLDIVKTPNRTIY